MRPLKPYKKMDTLGQFLHYDGKVLRFWGFWDDRPVQHGDLRDIVLLYYLADDTIEVKETVPQNAGRYRTPSLVRRDRLPKVRRDGEDGLRWGRCGGRTGPVVVDMAAEWEQR